MQHNVSELEGAVLDFAVARAERHLTLWRDDDDVNGRSVNTNDTVGMFLGYVGTGEPRYSPSTDWAHGGQIIEREKILMAPLEHGGWRAVHMPSGNEGPPVVVAHLEVDGENERFTAASPTVAMEAKYPLIAAMRAYVASRFGETVDLP